MNIFHTSAEFYPYIKMGGLSDMLASLAKEEAKNNKVMVALPMISGLQDQPKFTGKKFSCIHPNAVIGSESSFILRDSIFLEAKIGDVYLYFFDSPLFRNLNRIYENSNEHYSFALFSYACFHLSLELKADIVHCHDWHTAITSYFHSSSVDGLPTVFTIHNLAYQGTHPEHICGFLKGEPFYLNLDIMKHDGKINYMKSAISTATKVTTVSPTYRDEVLWEPQGCGLSFNLRKRGADFLGILNGIDEDEWNPDLDSRLIQNFNRTTISQGKLANKIALYDEIGRKIDPSRPLIGLVGRLTWQKGYKYFLEAFLENAELPFYYIFLGSGDPNLEGELFHYSHHFQDRIFFYKGYSEQFARRIEASSDFFLMPSLFEPCGLNQMYSHAYGAIPIVSRVGGLRDTIKEDLYDVENSTGLLFEPGSTTSLKAALTRAHELYENKEKIEKIRTRIFAQDWTWKTRLQEFTNLYQDAIKKKG
ncbi:glycogen/starch synthase [Leptospira sp. GIMC2001]|uniref:glycogen/starch synthase n=1 Tax=Leptospira sp. GIMC2001 TaxID=1513297 RepID=UPI00234A390F|nr:glycogen/starch synthase [Leptospira sp. GIMC2001]WCL50425.1 glycogen/starch synthase [Leptospira sp. GIMC2001]